MHRTKGARHSDQDLLSREDLPFHESAGDVRHEVEHRKQRHVVCAERRVGWSLPREATIIVMITQGQVDATPWLPYRPAIDGDRTRHYAIDTFRDTFAP